MLSTPTLILDNWTSCIHVAFITVLHDFRDGCGVYTDDVSTFNYSRVRVMTSPTFEWSIERLLTLESSLLDPLLMMDVGRLFILAGYCDAIVYILRSRVAVFD